MPTTFFRDSRGSWGRLRAEGLGEFCSSEELEGASLRRLEGAVAMLNEPRPACQAVVGSFLSWVYGDVDILQDA